MPFKWLIFLGLLTILSCWGLGNTTYGMDIAFQFGTMFGVILFLYGVLLMPFRHSWLLQGAKCLRILGSFIMAILFLLFIGVQGLIWQEADGDKFEGNALIILGAAIHGETPSLVLQSRLDAGLNYLLYHPDCVVVVSGGQGSGEKISEAEAMARYLMDRGIEADRIIIENQAKNTVQNIQYALDCLAEENISWQEPIGIVSNDFHLFRVKQIAEQLGVSAAAISAPTPSVNGLPWVMACREFFAIGKMFLMRLAF